MDVGDVTKDAEYCVNLAKNSTLAVEEKYGCEIIAFVSDSESKRYLPRMDGKNVCLWMLGPLCKPYINGCNSCTY
jgi:hypothetical protein